MWHGVVPVSSGYDPIISETEAPAVLTVVNAGPGAVELRGWHDPQPRTDATPNVKMELRAGAMRTVQGRLFRVHIKAPDVHGGTQPGEFAAIAWRLEGMGWWGSLG
jgi:hypothetical protein